MVSQMLKTMRETQDDSESGGLSMGSGNPLQGMFDWELARSLAQRNPLGIAADLMKRMAPALREEAPSSDYDEIINRRATEQHLDPRLIKAVINAESGGDTTAISPKGAKGLMQLMDSTATGVGVADPFDPDDNVRGGVAYLKQLLNRYDGDTTLALAAYNAGPAAVDRHQGIPPYAETQAYVRKVMDNYAQHRDNETPLK